MSRTIGSLMTARNVCKACLRASRYQKHGQQTTIQRSSSLQWPQVSARSLTTSSHLAANAEPKSLDVPSIPVPKSDPPPKDVAFQPPQARVESTATRLAREMRKRASAATETYVAYGVTEKLFKECSRQAEYTIPQALERGQAPKTAAGEDLGVGTGWWYETLGLTPTFSTWAQITFLHMYLLTVRIRYFPPDHAPSWHQYLINHFSYAAEERMVTYHGMAAGGIRNRYLKDLFIQWRGVLAAYDEGLMRGDAVLAAAVWRNVFKADEEADPRHLAVVVAFMRRALKALDDVGDEVVAGGNIRFEYPDKEMALVMPKSRGLVEPFEEVRQTESVEAKA